MPCADEPNANDNGRRFVAKGSFVFNIAQVTGVKRSDPSPRPHFDPIADAEQFIADSGIPIEYAGDHPCYVSARDLVRLPRRDQFVSRDAYYSTAFHELAHATGHKSRLDRDLTGRFGTAAYAMEELVAELGSAFVMAGLRLSPEPHPDSLAYLANWLQVLRFDKRAIFTAASAASRAAAYLTDASRRSAADGSSVGSVRCDAASATPAQQMAA
jgi:antirestriction protein ArdC